MFKNFIDSCLDGDAKPADVDNWVSNWHDNAPESQELTLDEYLGLTPEEGAVWARYPSRLEEILAERRARQHSA